MIKGYKRLKPSDLKPRNPWSFWHMARALELLDLNTYTGNVNASILSIGHFLGGRVGEYASKSRKDWHKLVNVNDVQLIKVGHDLKSIIVNFRFAKNNKDGYYSGKVEAVCSCKSGVCPVHIIARYLKIRWNVFGANRNSDPLLLTSKGLPVRQQHVNNLIKSLARDLQLDPTVYSSHSLRAGRATDLARAFKPDWFIKKWGRWRSNCWQDFYAKLDFTDIAIMSNLTLNQLGLSGNSINLVSE